MLAGLCASVALFAKPESVRSDGPVSLKQLLEARVDAIDSLKASVAFTRRPGKDVTVFSANQKKFAEWLRAVEHDAETADQVQARSALLDKPRASPTRYFLFHGNGGRCRAEEFSGPSLNAPARSLQVFTGNQWQMLTPRSAKYRNPEMTITGDYRATLPAIDVARGVALPVDARLAVHLPVPKEALASGSLSLRDAFDSLFSGGSSREYFEPLASGGPPLPVLELATPEFRDTGRGYYQVRWFFDPRNGYCPVRMECSVLEPHRSSGGTTYLLTEAVDWAKPVDLGNGQRFPCHATIHYGLRDAPVEDGVSSNDWQGRSFEMHNHDFEFSKLSDDAASDGLYAIHPPAGTNVVNEMAGERYLVGSAGQQLERTALALRSDLGAAVPPNSHWSWRRRIAVTVGLIVAAVAGWLAVRKGYHG